MPSNCMVIAKVKLAAARIILPLEKNACSYLSEWYTKNEMKPALMPQAAPVAPIKSLML